MIQLQEILYRVVNELLIEAASLMGLKQKYYSNIDDNTFNEIVQADPTYRQNAPDKMGQYTKWLLNLYRKKNLKIEGLYKAT